MLFGLHLALRGEPRAHQSRPHDVSEFRLGQKQEIVRSATPHAKGRDDSSLCRQQERREDVSFLLHVLIPDSIDQR